MDFPGEVAAPVAVASGTIGVRARPEEEGEPWARLAIVADLRGAAAVDVVDGRNFALQRLMDERGAGSDSVVQDDSLTQPVRKAIDHVLRRTHRGVSRRWIRRYAVALGWLHGRRIADVDPERALMSAALRGTPRTLAQLTPPRVVGRWMPPPILTDEAQRPSP